MAEHKSPSHGSSDQYLSNESTDTLIMLLRRLKSTDLDRIERGISAISASDAECDLIKEHIGQIKSKRSNALHEADEALEDILRKGGDWRLLSKKLNGHGSKDCNIDEQRPNKSIKRRNDIASSMTRLMRAQNTRRLRRRPGTSKPSVVSSPAQEMDACVSKTESLSPVMDTIVSDKSSTTPLMSKQVQSSERVYPKPDIKIPSVASKAPGDSENPFVISPSRKKSDSSDKALVTQDNKDRSALESSRRPAATSVTSAEVPEKASLLSAMSLEELEALERKLKALNQSKIDRMIEEQNEILKKKERQRKAEEILERRKQDQARRVAQQTDSTSRDITADTRTKTSVGFPKAPPQSSDALKLAESFGLDISSLAAEIQQRHRHRTRSGTEVPVRHKKSRRGSW